MSIQPRDDGADERPPYLAMAAHELRAPATVMVGAADTLLRIVDADRLGPEAVELLASLARNGRRLHRLVVDLLSDAYLDEGALPLAIATLPIEPVLGWAVRAAGHDQDEDEVAVAVDCDPLLHGDVDPDRLEQIVCNLVANALEHGAPPVTVSASAPACDGRVAIVVRDHGVGVDEVDAERLFDRFTPLAHRTARSTGLGLSIARDLARAMGGDVTYRRADPGSMFVLELPAPSR
jgi:signal transduction histidine kinase